jgi:hypothetical protein
MRSFCADTSWLVYLGVEVMMQLVDTGKGVHVILYNIGYSIDHAA